MTDKFDIIGDIHGHAEVLRRLLFKLDYRLVDGVFRHSDRRVIYVGDFIDRGPHQRDVLHIARSMCEAGQALAVMGNHEFNAIGWAEPDGNGDFLRTHSRNNAHQHYEFLQQLGEGSAAHKDALSWFRSLPVWLDLPGLRVVHACWHSPAQDFLRKHLDSENRFTRDGFQACSRKGTPAYDAAEILLKGPEITLPDGAFFLDKQEHVRHEARVRWWDGSATTLRTAALGMEGKEQSLPDLPVPDTFTYHDEAPVFFGHYWLKGRPYLTSPQAACLDFSVAKQGCLTAYRWSGERHLSADNFIYVDAIVQ